MLQKKKFINTSSTRLHGLHPISPVIQWRFSATKKSGFRFTAKKHNMQYNEENQCIAQNHIKVMKRWCFAKPNLPNSSCSKSLESHKITEIRYLALQWRNVTHFAFHGLQSAVDLVDEIFQSVQFKRLASIVRRMQRWLCCELTRMRLKHCW